MIFLPYLLCLLSLVLCGQPALANSSSDASPAPNFVSVPVYYVTDREKTKDSYGSQRRYLTNCQHNMYYGTDYVTVPNDLHKVPGDKFKQLGWKVADGKAAKVSPKEAIAASDPEIEKKQFFNLIKQALDKYGDDQLCVFAHGADDAFEDAASDAAELAYFIERPLVMYSWPSVPKMLSYQTDSGNNEWSQEHFDTFFRDLLALKQEHPLHVIAICHSMGNRLFVRMVHVIYGSHLMNDIELVSPDIDEETFKHYVMGMQSQDTDLRLYVSRKDKMLPLSQMLSGGYYRLGEGIGSVLPKSLQPSKQAAAPVKSMAKQVGHVVLCDEPTGTKPPLGQIQLIDFTEIDEGFKGHSIPFQLLADMINHDQPGHGLRLVGDAGHANRLARFSTWTHHLQGVSNTESAEYMERVIRVPKDTTKEASK